MRKEGYRSVQIRKSAAAALESTAVRLSVSASAIIRSPRRRLASAPMHKQQEPSKTFVPVERAEPFGAHNQCRRKSAEMLSARRRGGTA